jgi:hypothetical protein
MNIKITSFCKLSLLFALLVLAPIVGAQTILTTTTLSSAAQGMGSVNGATPTGNQSIISVASATGINAPAPNTSLTSGIIATSEAQTYLYVDRELMQVKAVSGTTILVIRGVSGTYAPSHASGAVVIIVPAAVFGSWSGGGADSGPQGPSFPQGSCTRTNELYLPRIQFSSGSISDCLGGQWINGDAAQTTRIHSKVLYAPQPGAVLYTGINTTGTATVAGTLFCTEIQLPYSKLLTGLAVLNGTTVGTDNHLVALYDSGGNLLANSAVAGVLAATASNYQQISFTAPYYAVGPAQYFGCVQSNGTTATVRMLVTQVQDQYLTKSVAGTFGTVPATITAPTTFTTAVGPYFGLF